MDYESAPTYKEKSNHLLTVQATDYWIYSPEFKKILALAMGEQFGSKITGISVSSPCAEWQTLVFVDAACNRWTVTIRRDDQILHVSSLFPFSNTDFKGMVSKQAHELTDGGKVGLSGLPVGMRLGIGFMDLQIRRRFNHLPFSLLTSILDKSVQMGAAM